MSGKYPVQLVLIIDKALDFYATVKEISYVGDVIDYFHSTGLVVVNCNRFLAQDIKDYEGIELIEEIPYMREDAGVYV